MPRAPRPLHKACENTKAAVDIFVQTFHTRWAACSAPSLPSAASSAPRAFRHPWACAAAAAAACLTLLPHETPQHRAKGKNNYIMRRGYRLASSSSKGFSNPCSVPHHTSSASHSKRSLCSYICFIYTIHNSAELQLDGGQGRQQNTGAASNMHSIANQLMWVAEDVSRGDAWRPVRRGNLVMYRPAHRSEFLDGRQPPFPRRIPQLWRAGFQKARKRAVRI